MHVMKSSAEMLIDDLDGIVALAHELIEASTIRRVSRNPRSGIVVVAPNFTWGPLDDHQRLLQRRALELWRPWLERMELLYSADTESRKKKLLKAASTVQGWIERNRWQWSLPPTIDEARRVFDAQAAPVYDALRALVSMESDLLVVPDTNVLIRSPDIVKYAEVLGTNEYVVMLVPGILAELDAQKVNHRNPGYRERALKVSNRIKGWRNQGDLSRGVKVQEKIYVRVEGREPDFTKTLSWLDKDVVDDRILASTLELTRREPSARVVLLTGDTIMLAKADAARVLTADTPDPEP